MKKSIGKLGTILIILVTVILAGVAIFTALRLYQLRQQPVAPNVPSSEPKAETAPTPRPGNCTDDVNPVACPDGSHKGRDPLNNCEFKPCEGSCLLGFTLSTQTSSPTPTATPTVSPTGTPGPSATPNSCGGTCGSNSNCASGLYCNTNVGFCRNAACPAEADCNCPSAATSAPVTPAPSLPVSGTDWPTIFGAGIGLFVIIGSLLLAL